MRGNWIRWAILAVMLAFGATAGARLSLACGGYGGLTVEVLRALADDSDKTLVGKLREQGPEALEQLMRLRGLMQRQVAELYKQPDSPERTTAIGQIERRQARLNELIDQVGMQRHCSRSGLYWYTDLEQAKAAARQCGKPILSLRMLGNLNEDFSCANSRFFRTTLYANDEISKSLRENYVLHWKSVRPVPRVTIDFGDGRKLERTLTGNSIHYILTPDGDVVDALPGLFGPKAFLQKIGEGVSLARRVATMSPEERALALAAYHGERFRALGEAFASDVEKTKSVAAVASVHVPGPLVQTAVAANKIAAPKGRVERPLVEAAVPLAARQPVTSPDELQDEAVWTAIAALHAGEAELDQASRDLIRSENPQAAAAGRLAITKRVVEDPMLRLVRTLQQTIALDTVRNEYQLHRRIHQWLADAGYRPEVDVLNERVYAELFLTPSSDPWLGLAGADVYTALPNGGVAKNTR
ncbi:MAG: thioredoxin family protein [Planctomycetaceae bacterium]|nr:thioredoxin family protein [Planctomycetaceae bacterium]